MKITHSLTAAFAIAGALAIAAAPATAATETPAVSSPGTTNSNAPVAGANSYTESQAQAQIESKGFSQVTELRQDTNGVWRGKAMKNGHNMHVAVDFQGNVTTN